MKAEKEKRAAIIRAEGESESAKLIWDATAAAGMGFIELRRIEASREVPSTLAKTPNVAYLPKQGNMLLGRNATHSVGATAASGIGLIELRRIEVSREVPFTLAKTPNVAYLPKQGNLLLGLNALHVEFIGIGAVLVIVSCCGFIGAATYIARIYHKYCEVHVRFFISSAFWRIWYGCDNIFGEYAQHRRQQGMVAA
ncbi:hypothetical protein H5410_029757 [Solanum commersonii]|uniref:Prohibitin n=1 Tax=Solanum commersonii TaxID=4109 RepID=A0A9J5YCD3_SOLCO|nr:hypothetical protein H5410_029757 [Solanum commersonii]